MFLTKLLLKRLASRKLGTRKPLVQRAEAEEKFHQVTGYPGARARSVKVYEVSSVKFLIRLLHQIDVILVFSECFRAGYGAFSTFKFKVIEGTN